MKRAHIELHSKKFYIVCVKDAGSLERKQICTCKLNECISSSHNKYSIIIQNNNDNNNIEASIQFNSCKFIGSNQFLDRY